MNEFIEVWLLIMMLKGSVQLQVHKTQVQCEQTRIELIQVIPKKYTTENTKCIPVTKRRDYTIKY